MTVALIVVSLSARLAQEVAELAGQMAPGVTILPAGGADDGTLGTSLTKVSAALAQAGSPLLLLTDLISATMIAEIALKQADACDQAQIAEAPLVEGAVAAAVQAHAGGSLAEVRQAAEDAMRPHVWTGAGVRPTQARALVRWQEPAQRQRRRTVGAELVLVNPRGLHARPAATLAAALGAMDAEIEINGVDAQSVIMLMTLDADQGSVLRVTASGPDAQRAVELVRCEVESGFGEL